MPPSRVLRATLPVKPSVTTTSARVGHEVAALDVADEAWRRSPIQAPSARSLWVSFTSGLPLVGSSPMDSRPTRGLGDAEAVAGVDGAHLGELHQPLGAALGVGAGVEQHRRRVAPGTGIGVAMAGRATPLMRPMRSSALAIVAPVLPALTMAEARPSRTASAARTSEESFMRAHARAGVGVHGDDLGRREHLEAAGVADLVGPADEHDGDAELGRAPAWRPRRSRRGPGRRPSRRRRWAGSSASVTGDAISRRRWPGGRGTSRSCRTRRGAAWLAPHRGQMLRAGASSVQAEARRLRLFALEVFFLGTAMVLVPLVGAVEGVVVTNGRS